ncbi:MAG: FMN-binding negative transcriptional regulator [Balneola sp.]|nr:MAG: FMN-binding negative transcriptional regulator [Balneola sp.]
MYIPSSFKEENEAILFDFIEEFNFGILFSSHEAKDQATHLPFLLDRKRGDRGTLIAHFARANKHWAEINEEGEVLCVFHGPHGYISPSWYKQRETVPTWNYSAVHIYGTPKIIEDTNELANMVTQLTQYHESQIETDWSLKEGEHKFESLLKAIVGIEIEIKTIEGKFKFNQNRSKEDQQGVIDHLDDSVSPGVKDIMKKNLISGNS